jgi:hypothetical protein
VRNFLLGLIVGAVGDRMLVNNGVSNNEVLSEVRRTLKKLDERLAEKEQDVSSTTEETKAP